MKVLHGDCVKLMKAMPDASVDSIVTDPPYGINFMGKAWDGKAIAEAAVSGVDHTKTTGRSASMHAGRYDVSLTGNAAFQVWTEAWAREALRVLKPGGHLLVFGSTRTYHRMACAIEDAGFEIRDSIHWLYGSGFPKSLDVSKAIDRQRHDRADIYKVTAWVKQARDAAGISNKDIDGAFGFVGMAGHWTSSKSQPTVPTLDQVPTLLEVLGVKAEEVPGDIRRLLWDLNGRKGQPGENWAKREVVGTKMSGIANRNEGPRHTIGASKAVEVDVTAPATDEAKQWEGWGTALKPAHEPIVVARKPLAGTVAANVLEHGTGALNIDGCRVGPGDGETRTYTAPDMRGGNYSDNEAYERDRLSYTSVDKGRWPANIIIDSAAGEALDQQSGTSRSTGGRIGKKEHGAVPVGGAGVFQKGDPGFGDTGGASRYFTRADFGPQDWPFVYQAKPSRRERNAGLNGLPEKRKAQLAGSDRDGPLDDVSERFRASPAANSHPTVKPVALMRHLVRLVTPPGGTVLDPFAGSGTTLVAAVLEGVDAVGCEMTDEYLPIIKARVAWAKQQVAAGQQLTLGTQ